MIICKSLNFSPCQYPIGVENVYVAWFLISWCLSCSYRCSYGPKDHRDNKDIRANHKRGCFANFSIKQEYIQPDATTISYYHMDHTRLDGSIVHGERDRSSDSRASRLALRISEATRVFIWNRLDAGFTTRQIFDEHLRVWQERKRLGESMRRDDYMTMENIRNLEKCHARRKWKRDDNETHSVASWIESNPQSIFIHQWVGEVPGLQEDKQRPFVLGIQTPEQCQVMLRFGNNNAISLDSTFGTSRVRYYLYTFLVYDNHCSGFPAAWVITNREMASCITLFMRALKERLMQQCPTFTPTCFLVDDNDATHTAIQYVLFFSTPSLF